MESLGEGVISLINQIYNQMTPTVQTMASNIVSKINLFAAIGAILYIFANLLRQIYYNEEINFLPYMRPFVILMLIPLSPKITAAIDTFADGIRVAASGSNLKISERIKTNAKKMQEAVDKKWDKIGSDEELYRQTFGNSRADDDGGWFPIADDLKLMFAKGTDEIKLALVLFMQNILVALMYVAEACLLLMSLCYKLLLKMGFPIAITLTIFPGFTNNLINWFAKYINFSLLPAVAAMYSSIAFALLNLYLDNDPVDLQTGTDTQSPEFLGFAYIGILCLSLVGYFFVPSMTSMLVSVGGVGQIMGGTTRAVNQAGNTASRAAGNAAQKTATVAGGAAKSATRMGVQGAVIGGAVASESGVGKVGKVAATVAGGMVGGTIGAVTGGIKAAKGSNNKNKKNI